MGLLQAYDHLDPFKTLVYSIPFNFYPILTLGFVFYLASTGKSYGPMKGFDNQTENDLVANQQETKEGKFQESWHEKIRKPFSAQRNS